jgi:hypothetical protein
MKANAYNSASGFDELGGILNGGGTILSGIGTAYRTYALRAGDQKSSGNALPYG